MKPKVERGYYHNVRSDNGCTVTQIKPNGETIVDEVPAGETTAVFAFSSEFDVSDDNAAVQQVFKLAPYQKLRLLGVVGGNDGLPSGYTRLEYLEVGTTAAYQRFVLDKTVDSSLGMRVKYKNLQATNDFFYSLIYQPSSQFSGLRLSSTWMAMSSTSSSYDTRTVSPPTTESFDVTVYNFMGDRKYGTNGVFATKLLNALKLPAEIDKLAFGAQYDAYAQVYREFYYKGRYYEVEVSRDTEIDVHLLPAIDSTGAPCMFDLVTRTPFYNTGSGAFIAGISTQAQLNNMLRKLPDRSGQDVGTLQVRLADELQTPENEARLDAMLSKNWEITQAA